MISKQHSRKYTALHDRLGAIFLEQERKKKDVKSRYEDCKMFFHSLKEKHEFDEKLQSENPDAVLFDLAQFNLLKDAVMQMYDFIQQLEPVLRALVDLFADTKLEMEVM